MFEIRYAIRFKRFLVVNTNFNPILLKSIAEAYMIGAHGIQCLMSSVVYDDGTGYYIFKLNKKYNSEMLIREISEQFQEYFYNHEN